MNAPTLSDERISDLCDSYREVCLNGEGEARPLDHNYEVELRKKLNEESYVSVEGMDRIVEWKTYSQGGRVKINQNRLRDVDERTVEDVTRAALREARRESADIRRPFHLLTALPGIGLGIASVVLAFACPKDFCVVDRYLRDAILGRGVDSQTTMKDVEDQITTLREGYRDSEHALRDIEKAHYYQYTTEHGLWP